MRALALVIALAASVGCGVKVCKSNTVLVDVTFRGASSDADKLVIAVTVAGVTHSQSLTRSPGASSGTIEIDFSKGYPSGKSVGVTLQAFANGALVGTGSGSAPANGSCQVLPLSITPTSGDMTVGGDLGDMGSADMPAPGSTDLLPATPDFGGCGYVFVSATTGNDANSGCDPSVPKQTITAALAIASAHDVLVCKGTYAENVSITRALNLRGGYSCTTWTRTAGFGYPTFDGANETIVHGATAGGYALTTSGGPLVEGFTIEAANGYPANADLSGTGTTAQSLAAHLTGSGGSFHDNHVAAGNSGRVIGAGNTPGQSTGSIGLDVSASGTDIFHNLIEGGSGDSATSFYGSAGVIVEAASHLHDNTVHCGSGRNTQGAASGNNGAVGIQLVSPVSLTRANNSAVENNVVGSCTGSLSVPNSGLVNVGVVFNGDTATATPDLDLIGNVIDAGTGNGTTIGISVFGHGAMSLVGNRVFGGKPTVSGAQAIGMQLQAFGTPALAAYDNEVQAGTPTTSGTSTVAVEINGNSFLLHHNTIHSGRGPVPGIGVWIVTANAVAIVNNLFLGEGESQAFKTEYCPNSFLTSWQANVYAFTGVVAQYGNNVGSPCTNGASFTTVDAFVTELAARGVAANAHNWLLQSTCGASSTCYALAGCTNPNNATTAMGGGCIGALQTYDQASDGVATLLSTGWTLLSGVPCVVSKTGLTDIDINVPGLARDWDGDPRSGSYDSIGADEFQGTCTP